MPAPLPPDDAELDRLLRHSLRTLPEVPRWASERALAVWRTPVTAPAPAAQPGLLQRLQAVLSFDSWQAQPALALRSGGHTRGARVARQLLYSVGEHDVDIRIHAQATPPGFDETQPLRFQISGQVLGPATRGSVTWLALGPDGQALAPTPAGDAEQGARSVSFDELGEFVLDDLPAGRGLVRLRLGSATADLPTLDLQGGALPPGPQTPPAG